MTDKHSFLYIRYVNLYMYIYVYEVFLVLPKKHFLVRQMLVRNGDGRRQNPWKFFMRTAAISKTVDLRETVNDHHLH